METSDVRSIEAIRALRGAVLELGHDWDLALQQIRFSMHRVEEQFTTILPAYWKSQTRAAEQTLAEAINNHSRQQGISADGNAPALSEARHRVQVAKNRLAVCEDKRRKAAKLAIQIELACQELAGPIAEVVDHSGTTLPNAADFLAKLIGFLDQYTESLGPANTEPSLGPNTDSTGHETNPTISVNASQRMP